LSTPDSRGEAEGRELGRFVVRTAPERIAAFRASIAAIFPAAAPESAAAPVEAAVPPTFPIVWLAEPEVRGALLAALGIDPFAGGAALIHLEQRIAYFAPLEPGRAFEAAVRLSRPAPERATVSVEVRDAEGSIAVRLASEFLLRGAEP
jgi:hypothetical protein